MFEANAIPYQIIGFDINETYLEKAKTGIYPRLVNNFVSHNKISC